MSDNEKIGIICESWKLPTFEAALSKAGIEYKVVSNENGVAAMSCTTTQKILKPIIDNITQYFIDLENNIKNSIKQSKHN